MQARLTHGSHVRYAHWRFILNKHDGNKVLIEGKELQ
jgi:hypothetical protein